VTIARDLSPLGQKRPLSLTNWNIAHAAIRLSGDRLFVDSRFRASETVALARDHVGLKGWQG